MMAMGSGMWFIDLEEKNILLHGFVNYPMESKKLSFSFVAWSGNEEAGKLPIETLENDEIGFWGTHFWEKFGTITTPTIPKRSPKRSIPSIPWTPGKYETSNYHPGDILETHKIPHFLGTINKILATNYQQIWVLISNHLSENWLFYLNLVLLFGEDWGK